MKTNFTRFFTKMLMPVFAVFVLLSLDNSAMAQTIVTIGTGTNVNSNTTYPAPYGNWYTGDKEQMLITAAELSAAGVSGGGITALAFNVATANGVALTGFTIKMGNTSVSSLTSTFITGLTTVYAPTAYTETAGWNTHTLTTPFTWDGVSNLVIETCFDKYSGGSNYTYNAIMYNSTTTFNSTVDYHSDGGGVCPSTSGTTYTKRPNMKLTFQPSAANDLALLAWSSPTSGTSPSATMPITVKVKNVGTAKQDTFAIKYSINNGASYTSVTYNDSLSAGDTLTYTFLTTANMSATALYNCIAVVKNAGDSANLNDTLRANLWIGNPLNGVYTIGADTADDFSSIGDAITAMSSFGISGPVKFMLDSGSYTGPFIMPAIATASATNTITFTSASGNVNDVVLTAAATGTSDNYTLRLDGADYYIIKNLTIKATNTNYATVVEVINGATHNLFYGNKLVSTGTNSYNRGVYDYNTNNNFNTYRMNAISGGYYGMYMYAVSSSNREKGTVIDSNDISGFYYYGIISYYQDSIRITNNYIHGITNIYGYGIYTYYNFNDFRILNNRIVLNTPGGYSYGMRVYYDNYYSYATSTTLPGLVANNMISLTGGTGTSYGLYAIYSDNVKYYNNSVLIADNSLNSRALYQYNTTSNTHGQAFRNNIFANTGGGYAAYFGTTTEPSIDYNDYYVTGTKLAYWGGDRANLLALQTASSKDTNSVSINPSFFSTSNLHTLSIPLNNLGSPVTEVTDDIDGDARSATSPDMGADEFTPPANDMSVISWVAPQTGITQSATVTITIKVANFGTATQSNIPVKYTVNGGLSYASEVIAGPIYSGDTATYTFSTMANFSTFGNHHCRALTDLTAEQNRLNDTIFKDVYACSPFSGAYTLGTSASNDFSSFADLAFALGNCGVGGPVTVFVDSGSYNEHAVFTAVAGASDTNTITITSASGNANDVVLTSFANGTGDNYTLKLDGANYFNIKNITISATNTSYATVVEVINGATHNLFYGNKILSTGTSSYNIPVRDYTTLNNYNTYRKNIMSGGYYGMYMYGVSSSNREKGTVIDSNDISGFYYYGLMSYYQDSIQITHNYIHDPSYGYYGLYTYYNFNGFNFSNNKIVMNGTSSTTYGMRVYYCNYYYYAGTSAAGLVSNNFITTLTGNGYGLYAYYSDNVKYYHNTVNVTSGTSGYALYQYNTTSNTHGDVFKNNIFMNTGGGYAARFGTTASVVASDYNDYYVTGANLAYWGGAKANLAALQLASSKDSNSVSINPEFNSNTDMHTLSIPFNNLGTPIAAVTTDIDGESRSATNPDMGADEFTPPANNLGVVALVGTFDQYCGAADSMFVQVKNFGTAAQSNVPVSFVGTSPNGAISMSGVISSIASQATATVYVGIFNATAFGNYSFKAYATLATDSLPLNDTLSGSGEVYQPEAIAYTQDFSTWPPAKWDMIGNGTFTWAQNGGSAAYADFWNYPSGNTAEMISPAVILPATKAAFLGFNYSYYGGYTSSYVDTLAVYAKSCSDSAWTLLWKKGGADLATPNGGATSPGTYVDASVQIPVGMQGSDVRIKFEGISDYGPNVFVDGMTVINAPAVSLGADTAICAGASVTIDAGTFYNASFIWTKGIDTVGTSQTLNVTTSGTYVAHVNQFGLTGIDAINISVNALPTVTFLGLAANYCENSTAATLSSLPAGGTYTGNGMVGNSFDPALAGLGIQSLTYTYTDANGCSNSATASTNVNAVPVVTNSGNVTICQGTSTTLTAGVSTVASNLFFSEYTEGTSNNKALEIFNGTGDTVYLANYRIAQSTNGSAWLFYHTFPAGAYILNGDVWVIVANQISATMFDTNNADEVLSYPSAVHHNGNDARAIIKINGSDTTFIDVIGLVTGNPGTGWDVAGVTAATANHTIIRKANITQGNMSWSSVAGTDSLSSEYLVYPVNYFSNLGMHTMSGSANYIWSNGDNTASTTVSPSTTTAYTVTVTGVNSCETTNTITVTVNPAPSVNLGSDQGLCASQNLMLDGGAGYTYLWNNGDTTQTIIADSTGIGIGTGNYSIVVTDSNMCNGYDTIALTFMSEPTVSIVGLDTVKLSWNVTLDAGAGFSTYLWNNGWTNQTVVLGANTLTAGADTTFNVTVTNANGCTGADAITFYVKNDVGFNDANIDMNLGIYPNPSNGQFNIEISGFNGELDMNILDLSGKVVYEEQLNVRNNFSKKFDARKLAKGVYYIKFISADGVKVEKLIIQ